MKKPILKLPMNVGQLENERTYATSRVTAIEDQESKLKREYSAGNLVLQQKISNLRRELKTATAELSRFQRENRLARRKLSEERVRLTKDLKNLSGRYSSLISRSRKGVREEPGKAFRLMERVK